MLMITSVFVTVSTVNDAQGATSSEDVSSLAKTINRVGRLTYPVLIVSRSGDLFYFN